ncbi:unnamed protein product [Coregonus sp. 'balchen']|nr:unnamed protein product [Coregonus sp. 'balchen']
MLSDEFDSKPELLVQFVQNASIPLGQGLEDSEPKHICLPLLAPADSSLCTQLGLTEGGLSHVSARSPSLSEFGGAERSSMVVHHHHPRNPYTPPSPPLVLHDLQRSESTSYVLLNLAKGLAASSEPLIFSADGAEEEEEEVISSGECGLDGTAPWYLRVQELAHDSLIAATRAQLAKDAKASQDARAGNGSNSNVHMRTHNGDKPFICKEKNCSKKFTTAGNLKNHKRTHTGEKPFLCEADGCGRSFAEYSSLRKHTLSGSRNVHMRKRHGEEALGNEGRETGEALTHSSLLEADGSPGDTMVTMTTGVEPINIHHAMLRGQGSADSVVVLAQPHDLVTMTTASHTYAEDVVALL